MVKGSGVDAVVSTYRQSSTDAQKTPTSTSTAKTTPPVQVTPNQMHPDKYKPSAGQFFTPVKPHWEVRVCPWDKPCIKYTYACHYFHPGFHYFGYRVKKLPPLAYRIIHHHHHYYCHQGIYYRYINGYYRVCRPPYTTVLALEKMRELELMQVRIRYYNEIDRQYKAINENNKYIVEQNATIAKNNAIIAEQQRIIAENQAKIAMQNSHLSTAPVIAGTTMDNRYLAAKAFETAEAAGLVQNFAAAGMNYYYQDGIFYIIEDNQYKVIIPPAGALVECLPEDYNIVTLAGEEYYEVDNTVYKVTNLDGTAYFEVVGQIEG